MNSNKYICIFGGGGIRGIAYIGALKALKELKIQCDTFVGSSVGAIFAAFCTIGYTYEEIKEIMYEFNASVFKDINIGISAEFALSKGEVFENWLREKIERKFYGEKYKKGENPPVTFSDIEKDLFILATDIASNSQFVFSKNRTSNFEIAKAVKISASFPGLMKPFEFEDKLLVDGDLAKAKPLWEICSELKNINSRILEFRLEGSKNSINIKNVLDYFNTVYSSMSNFCSEYIINNYNDKDNFDYILIDTKDLLILDFQIQNEKKDSLVKIGYETTKEYLTKELIEKKKSFLLLYKKIQKTLQEIKPHVKKGNALSTKKILTNFICNMDFKYTLLDKNFMNEFYSFKQALLADITETDFLPITILKNKVEHHKILQGLLEKLEFKINDLQDYIEKYCSIENKV